MRFVSKVSVTVQRSCAAPRAILRDSLAHNAQRDRRSIHVKSSVHLALKGATRIGHRLHADTGLNDADFASQVSKPRAPVRDLLVDAFLIDQCNTRRSDPHDDAHVSIAVVNEGKRAIIRINVLADTRSPKAVQEYERAHPGTTPDRPGPVHGTLELDDAEQTTHAQPSCPTHSRHGRL